MGALPEAVGRQAMDHRPEDPARRKLLTWLGLGVGGGIAGALLVGLGERDPPAARASAPPADAVTALPLEGLAPGGRRRVLHRDRPVELRRHEDGSVTARSLVCTHRGCEVRWSEADRVYRCPCHDGLFDEQGRVVLGPPPRPLRTLKVQVVAGSVLIGP